MQGLSLWPSFKGMVGGQKPIVTSTIALQCLISLKEITSVSYRTKQEKVLYIKKR